MRETLEVGSVAVESVDDVRKKIVLMRDQLRREGLHVSDPGVSQGIMQAVRLIEGTFSIRPGKFGSQW